MKTVIFDMDGVIVDTEKFYYDVRKQCFEKFNIQYTKQLNESFIGASPRYYEKTLRELCEKNNVNTIEFSKYFDDLVKKFDYYKIMFSGITDILSALKENGYKIGLASSSDIEEIDRVINSCKIHDYFDVILSGEMFEQTKPNPEIYLTAAKKLNEKPENCIVVEDSKIGILAAKRAGMYTYARKENRFSCDQSLADKTFEDYNELKKYILN